VKNMDDKKKPSNEAPDRNVDWVRSIEGTRGRYVIEKEDRGGRGKRRELSK